MDVGDNLDDLEEVIEGYNGVEEHEERFGNLENVFHFAGCAGLEIADTVIADVAYGATSEGWEV